MDCSERRVLISGDFDKKVSRFETFIIHVHRFITICMLDTWKESFVGEMSTVKFRY